MSSNDFSAFTNLYSLSKTLRFELRPVLINRQYNNSSKIDGELFEEIKNFVDKYQNLIESIEKFFFYINKEDGELKPRKKVYVKHSWLRNYTKTEFYNVREKIVVYDKNNRKRSNQISISDSNLGFLKDYFENWIKENKECVENLRSFLNQPKENQKRISEFAYWIQKISKRSNFESIFELFNGNIQHKDNDEKIDEIKKTLDECKLLLEELEKELLPSQSLGVEIERASLNYYAVNKKSRNYDQEIRNKEQETGNKLLAFEKFNKQTNKKEKVFILNQKLNFLVKEIKKLKNVSFVEENFDGINKAIKNFDYLKISSAYSFLKEYKAREKSKFYELLGQKKSIAEIKQDCPLFSCLDDNFNKIKGLTNQIATASNDEVRTSLKEKRGKHFDVIKENGNFCSFGNYKELCSLFQKIAMQFGKIKAEIKALEKEKIDAERLQSWAMILEKDNQKYVLTILRNANNNLSNAKKYVDDLKNDANETWKLYSFESLTLRALDKLCFGLDKNTFYPAIKDELQRKNNSFFINGNLKRKDQFSDDGLELIKFYQTVLGLASTKKMLAIDNFEGLQEAMEKEYGNKDQFEKDLKQCCYYKKAVFISDETKNKIINDFNGNFYKITNYDLGKNDQEEIAKLERKQQFDRSNSELHTKVWLDFWTGENIDGKYPIRLNPEMKINFVEKDLEVLRSNMLGKLKKNRKLNDRYLLSAIITLQAHEKSVDLAFKKTNEIVDFINEYNKEFRKKIKPFDIYYYGLDRGQKELLTLGIFKFSETEKVQFTKGDGTSGDYNKPEFIDIETYQIKLDKYLEKNSKERIAYKSVSEFVDDNNIIQKVPIISCFDMSCAKLIKDKIVINGDIPTYLELKRVSALRKIYEGFTRGKFRSDKICFDANNGTFFLNIENRGKIKNENLYFYDERFEMIISLDDIKNELQKYLDSLNGKLGYEMISIQRINNLRDAICANAIGILAHLQKKYFGMMFFENLDLVNKNLRLSQFSGNLASRIEWKILQKFQTLSLVPPNYKQVMELQSEKTIDQLGVVGYVNSEGTSSNCPHCGTKNTDKSEKWGSHSYKCKNSNCNFDSSDINKRNGLIGLDNSDRVAAYNIAKRGLDFMQKNR